LDAESAASAGLVERVARLPLAVGMDAELIDARPCRGIAERIEDLAGV